MIYMKLLLSCLIVFMAFGCATESNQGRSIASASTGIKSADFKLLFSYIDTGELIDSQGEECPLYVSTKTEKEGLGDKIVGSPDRPVLYYSKGTSKHRKKLLELSKELALRAQRTTLPDHSEQFDVKGLKVIFDQTWRVVSLSIEYDSLGTITCTDNIP